MSVLRLVPGVSLVLMLTSAAVSAVVVVPASDTVLDASPLPVRSLHDKTYFEPARIVPEEGSASAGLPMPATRFLVSDGFEGAFPGPWTVLGGPWGDTRDSAYAGTWSAEASAGSWMMQGPFDLSDANSALFSFRYRTRQEGRLEYLVSIDGVSFHGYKAEDESGGWRYASIDLKEVPVLGDVTGEPKVWIAFAIPGDGDAHSKGAFVDEVLLQKTVGAAADIRIDPLTLAFNRGGNPHIYLEIDWMEGNGHSHKPSQAVLDRIVQTFAAAGFTIHIDLSDAIPHQDVVDVGSSPSSSPDIKAIKDQYFDHAAEDYYYYSIWGHNYSRNGTFTTNGGVADLPGRVSLITLGSFSGQTGTFSNQVATLIHELGHNLGQLHGGLDSKNYKPTYLSVMNYYFSNDGIGPVLLAKGFANTSSGFDDFSYSHGLMPSVNENNLDEAFGIGLGKAVDWDCSGTITSGVSKDIQDLDYCYGAFETRETLTDWDNWTSLSSQIHTFGAPAAAAVPGRSEDCMSWEEYAPLHADIERLRRLGLLPPDAPDTAGPPASASLVEPTERSFVIHNDGGQALSVTSMALDVATPWIKWEPKAPFTVAPGGSQAVYVFVDVSQAPVGTTNRRILVQSNDPDESPYPGGVNLAVTASAPPVCYPLTLSHGGSGGDPAATPPATPGCPARQFAAGETVSLKASPTAGWAVAGWSGTANDASTGTFNSFVMPAAAHAAAVQYTQFPDVSLVNNVTRTDSMTADVPHGTWKFYFVDLLPGSTQLVVKLSGMNKDADLYARFNAKPEWGIADCISNLYGLGSETCTFASPAAGRWWIAVKNYGTGTLTYSLKASWNAPVLTPLDFYPVAPCRVVDTRTGSPLASGVSRTFTLAGACGVPASAKAVAVNVTTIGSTARGNVTLWPADLAKPTTSVINFGAGETRANNAILMLATNGTGLLSAQGFLADGGTVHLVVDVAGYFQ